MDFYNSLIGIVLIIIGAAIVLWIDYLIATQNGNFRIPCRTSCRLGATKRIVPQNNFFSFLTI